MVLLLYSCERDRERLRGDNINSSIDGVRMILDMQTTNTYAWQHVSSYTLDIFQSGRLEWRRPRPKNSKIGNSDECFHLLDSQLHKKLNQITILYYVCGHESVANNQILFVVETITNKYGGTIICLHILNYKINN